MCEKTLQQNVFLVMNFSEEKFFVTKNLHLVTKFIIRRKKWKKKVITFSDKIEISLLKWKIITFSDEIEISSLFVDLKQGRQKEKVRREFN